MPHAGDWITAILYLSAAYSCRSAAKRIQPEHREALFWMSIAVLFLVLAVVDLFGLQSAVTELSRSIAMKQGWYSQRYGSQVAFIEIISALTAVMAFGLLFGARRMSVQCMIALTFATLIVGYVVVRASSLHSVDALMARTVLGLHFNRIPEIAGIGIVLLASSTRA